MPTSGPAGSAVRLVAAVLVAVVTAGCRDDGSSASAESSFLADYRGQLEEVLGGEVPDYTDEELLTFGRRACDNLAEVASGADLRRSIEAASVGATDGETLQVAQATVLVASAAQHLCPEQGERLGLLEEDAPA